ncbi:protein kinase [Streptomyces sp. NPDC048248]|uniref:serine/threonine-protein kinase n=1 Tax=Streptomyces sp. NPDC048248 TaxID=3365523 RepID=UPI0037165279
MEPLAEDDPRVLGGYRLLGRLGAGGMGRVYLGRSAGGRTVAVKVVHAHFATDDQFRARFRREIESARRVGGAWTAPVLDADPDAAVPWIATGYVAGPSLAQAVADVGPLAEHSVRALGAGLAEALAAVHALGLVHRDVKPSNVLLTLDGPLLIDFGIARATEGTASLTSTGVSVGSPGYMAPEQILGKGTSGAADVFSLGAVLAYAATGAGPFSGDSSAALLYKIVHEEPELGGPLTGELRELVAGCLAKDPAARPAPHDLAARLAGAGGAAGLVRTGWLPAALVERVSRQVVELLNLDTGEGGAGPATGGGQATEAGAASWTGAHAPAPAPLGGAFGPPDPSYGAASGLVPFDAQAQLPAADGPVAQGHDVSGEPVAQKPHAGQGAGPPAGGGPGPSADASGPVGTSAPTPGPATEIPAFSAQAPGSPPYASWPVAGGQPDASGPRATGHGPAPGQAELPTAGPGTASATSAGSKERRIALTAAVGGRNRPRRVSCSLVLSVAGALAAATTAVFVFQLLPGDHGGDDTSARPPSDTGRTPSRGPGDPGSGGARPTVAKGFLGTWKGSVRMANGFPNGTMTSVVKAGGKGDYVIHTTYDVAGVLRCEAKSKLVASTGTRLRLTERPDGKQGPGCTGTTSEVTYTLGKDGTLSFVSADDAGGNPRATLTKGGG